MVGVDGSLPVPVPSWHFAEDADEEGEAGCPQVCEGGASCVPRRQAPASGLRASSHVSGSRGAGRWGRVHVSSLSHKGGSARRLRAACSRAAAHGPCLCPCIWVRRSRRVGERYTQGGGGASVRSLCRGHLHAALTAPPAGPDHASEGGHAQVLRPQVRPICMQDRSQA